MNIDIKIAKKTISILRNYVERRNNAEKRKNEIIWEKKFKKNTKILFFLDNHTKIYLYKNSILSRLVYNGFEEDEIKFINKFLKPGDVFFDIGANIGLFTITAAKILGCNGEVHAFEPTPNTYERLVENININNFGSIVKHNKLGLSDLNEILKFNISVDGHDAWNTFANCAKLNFDGQIDVNVLTLDEYISENLEQRKIDLIKIDVEGWEFKVFNGSVNLLSSLNAPPLIVEFTDSNLRAAGSNSRELFNFIESYGYRWFKYDAKSNSLIQETRKDFYPYNNLIAVKDEFLSEVEARLKQK